MTGLVQLKVTRPSCTPVHKVGASLIVMLAWCVCSPHMLAPCLLVWCCCVQRQCEPCSEAELCDWALLCIKPTTHLSLVFCWYGDMACGKWHPSCFKMRLHPAASHRMPRADGKQLDAIGLPPSWLLDIDASAIMAALW